MPLRAAGYGTALLMGLLFLAGQAPAPSVPRFAEQISARSGERARPSELVSGFADPTRVALAPSWTSETALQARAAQRMLRLAGRVAPSVERRFDGSAVALPPFLRITPFANPECASAAARTRAGACSSFATTLPPPARA